MAMRPFINSLALTLTASAAFGHAQTVGQNKTPGAADISSVVLSGQRVDMKESLYDAMKGKDQAKATVANPLIMEGRKLIPSVTRVFSTGKELYVYVQGYEQAGTPTKPLVAYVSFYRDKVKAYETNPIAVTPASTAKLTPVPLTFDIGLAALPPGEYQCQVTILDPTDAKATFWQEEIKLIDR